ncbi:MAG TPA: cupin domain-containing protein [Gaiellaceae bacterium]|jgi:quercetin dioxygenase-like cupin family protein
MLTVDTTTLELTQVWWEGAPNQRVRVTFPINRFAGSEDSAVVYFEIAPGDRLPLHTDSAEEILYIVSGELEAQVGDERGRLTAGSLAVIPAMVPHGAVNTGDEVVKVVGFFSESEITSTFDEPIQPFGVAETVQGAPAPAAA